MLLQTAFNPLEAELGSPRSNNNLHVSSPYCRMTLLYNCIDQQVVKSFTLVVVPFVVDPCVFSCNLFTLLTRPSANFFNLSSWASFSITQGNVDLTSFCFNTFPYQVAKSHCQLKSIPLKIQIALIQTTEYCQCFGVQSFMSPWVQLRRFFSSSVWTLITFLRARYSSTSRLKPHQRFFPIHLWWGVQVFVQVIMCFPYKFV